MFYAKVREIHQRGEKTAVPQHTTLRSLHIHSQAFVRTCMRKQSFKSAFISMFQRQIVF